MATAQLTRLSYWYPGAGSPALDGVSLELDGGVTLVAGPSGGGKSTLLRVLNGLVPHFHGGRIAGEAVVAGTSVLESSTRRLARSVGFVFQDPELQTVYDTVEREVAFGLENVAFPPREMPSLVEHALDEVGAQHLRQRRMRTLSGGERQRVALASTLVMRPRLVALDEPTSQLDDDGASLVLSAVKRVAENGRSVVISEHRHEPLTQIVTGVVEVERGRVRTYDPSDWAAPALPSPSPPPPGGDERAWSITGLVAGFDGRPVLRDVTLAGRRGEVLALRGPNGGGKTTLLRAIAGLLPPMRGRVERGPGRIAYLPQNPAALLHRPTVRSEVELTLDRAGDRESPDVILEALGLTAVAGAYPRDLSSGQRQRAALAAVLAGRPDLVLLDEPTRGMDVEARLMLMRLLARLRERGAAIVLATHDSALRGAVASRTATVDRGIAVETEVVAP